MITLSSNVAATALLATGRNENITPLASLGIVNTRSSGCPILRRTRADSKKRLMTTRGLRRNSKASPRPNQSKRNPAMLGTNRLRRRLRSRR
jgi:hypothetical protein